MIDATVAEEDYDVESGGKRVAPPGETFNNTRRQDDTVRMSCRCDYKWTRFYRLKCVFNLLAHEVAAETCELEIGCASPTNN